MDCSKELKKINISETYKTEIFGLGEVYEIMSVENKRKNIAKIFPKGIIYLASNKNHSGRGMTLKELEFFAKDNSIKPTKIGFADSPPWLSCPLNKENKKRYPATIVLVSKIIFWFFIKLEKFWESPKKSHMIYLFSEEKDF